MKRRNFLKGLAAAAALAFSSLVPDLAPRRRATRWRITVEDPYRPDLHVAHIRLSDDVRVFEGSMDDRDAIRRAIIEANVQATMDRILYGTSRVYAEGIA